MSVTEAVRAPEKALLEWLATHGVDYELTEHPLTFTARETARVEGIDPRRFAKTLGVETADGRRALVVVEATEKVDLGELRYSFGFGLFWSSPFGPLKLSIAQPLNLKSGFDRAERLQFTFGSAF